MLFAAIITIILAATSQVHGYAQAIVKCANKEKTVLTTEAWFYDGPGDIGGWPTYKHYIGGMVSQLQVSLGSVATSETSRLPDQAIAIVRPQFAKSKYFTRDAQYLEKMAEKLRDFYWDGLLHPEKATLDFGYQHPTIESYGSGYAHGLCSNAQDYILGVLLSNLKKATVYGQYVMTCRDSDNCKDPKCRSAEFSNNATNSYSYLIPNDVSESNFRAMIDSPCGILPKGCTCDYVGPGYEFTAGIRAIIQSDKHFGDNLQIDFKVFSGNDNCPPPLGAVIQFFFGIAETIVPLLKLEAKVAEQVGEKIKGYSESINKLPTWTIGNCRLF
ncbi:hypothetical protein HDV05_000007 [Chytridiales sp. JEL 0842]|nr:hypothetical protein HDV05_000007 [Chytridiales sp. JEL 0842]